jgi:tetratricopeptide (TPR) repeat protein
MQVRPAVPLLLLCLVATGCASALQRSIRAYERGDFREAHELLARVDAHEGAEVREAVAGGIDYSTSYLLSQAWVALERGKSKPYREALAYYHAALEVMPSDHPRRAETEKAVAAVERDMTAVREKERAAASRFRVAAKNRDYAAAVTIAHEVIELMRSVGGGDLDASDVLNLAEQAMGDADHEVAVQLVEIADLVRREARAHLDQSDMGEVARVAAALRYFRRVEEDGTATVRAPAAKKPAVRRAPSTKPEVVEPAAPEPPSDAGEREARASLKAARAQWNAGNKYEALVILDDAMTMLGGRAGLEEQRQKWEPMRALLIADYVERGELALSREASAEARGWYERILTLDPTHELAHDRLRKLEKLQELQSSTNR